VNSESTKMIESELLQILKNGESSTVEFKTEAVNPASLAEEVVAFANFEGGTVFIGVGGDGTISGCARSDLEELMPSAIAIIRSPDRP
jgi:ATP-dependent DNA helicase RecG